MLWDLQPESILFHSDQFSLSSVLPFGVLSGPTHLWAGAESLHNPEVIAFGSPSLTASHGLLVFLLLCFANCPVPRPYTDHQHHLSEEDVLQPDEHR